MKNSAISFFRDKKTGNYMRCMDDGKTYPCFDFLVDNIDPIDFIINEGGMDDIDMIIETFMTDGNHKEVVKTFENLFYDYFYWATQECFLPSGWYDEYANTLKRITSSKYEIIAVGINDKSYPVSTIDVNGRDIVIGGLERFITDNFYCDYKSDEHSINHFLLDDFFNKKLDQQSVYVNIKTDDDLDVFGQEFIAIYQDDNIINLKFKNNDDMVMFRLKTKLAIDRFEVVDKERVIKSLEKMFEFMS